jgi:hypothetical protein
MRDNEGNFKLFDATYNVLANAVTYFDKSVGYASKMFITLAQRWPAVVAQLVEQSANDPKVEGLNPTASGTG